MVCPASCSATSVGTAKAGVPMKTIRILPVRDGRMASQEIEALAGALARLPGLGPRSARRAVLWLVKRRETALVQLLDALAMVRGSLVECRVCGNVDTQDPSGIC